jgi:hypothetical protein
MGFVVGSIFIMGLLVVIIAFGARLAQIVDETKEKFRKRSIR